MKSNEFLSESQAGLPDDLQKILSEKGYRYINAGAEHTVWLGPDGFVYKIMPPRFIKEETAKKLQMGSKRPEDVYVTKAQQCFIDWVEYCQNHPNNKFLPFFDDWKPYIHEFVRDNKKYYYFYIQCRTERLFPLHDWKKLTWADTDLITGEIDWGQALSEIAYDIAYGMSKQGFIKRLKNGAARQGTYQVVSHMGDQRTLTLFYDTITDLIRIATNKGYRLDLHSDNFMLGSDGHIVINDPFFIRYAPENDMYSS
jgi:hypothetical protein